MKIAVIGAGYWGKNHVRELKKLGHEVTVCDLDEKNLDFCKTNFQADHITTKLGDILLEKSITAATICLPNHMHFSVAKKLLGSGKHLLVEKPMCLKSSECKKLVTLAEKKKLVLNVGHIFRFNPSIIKLRSFLESGQLGKIFLVHFSWTNLDPVYIDRDIISDLGVHPFDIFNFLFEKSPKIVSCTGDVFRKGSSTELAFITAKQGAVFAFFELSWITPEKKRIVTIVGEKKTAIVDTMVQSITLIDASLQKESIVLENKNPLQEELGYFVECIEKGIPSKASGKIGMGIVKLIEEAQRKLK